MDESHDSGIGIEKDNQDVKNLDESQSPSDTSLRRQYFNKKKFKSLTVLNERNLSENLQKIHRRSDGNRRIFFCRGLTNGEKRNRKKYYRKKFEKSNVSEMNILKVTNELDTDENPKLVNVIDPWKFINKPGKVTHKFESTIEDVDHNVLEFNDDINAKLSEKNTNDSKNIDTQEIEGSSKILQCFEKLRLCENFSDINSLQKDHNAPNCAEAKSAIDYSSGDVQQDFSLDLNLRLLDENFSEIACAQIFDSKRRSVQWKREVDVIYYVGDSNEGKVVRRENEPLREEIEQQARRNKFIQLALTKKLLSVSACQLRDPWLVVLPK